MTLGDTWVNTFNRYIFILIDSNWEKYSLLAYPMHNFMGIIAKTEAIRKEGNGLKSHGKSLTGDVEIIADIIEVAQESATASNHQSSLEKLN